MFTGASCLGPCHSVGHTSSAGQVSVYICILLCCGVGDCKKHMMCFTFIFSARCGCMRDEGINQRLHKATLLKTLQVKKKFLSSESFVYNCLHYLTTIHWWCPQDSLGQVLENPRWHSESADFSAVLQPAPVILEPITDSVSKEKLLPDAITQRLSNNSKRL